MIDRKEAARRGAETRRRNRENAEQDRRAREHMAAAMLDALHWTEPVMCDVPVPSGADYTEGWEYNALSQRVWRAWSTSTRHGEGTYDPHRYVMGSQNGVALYSSVERALRALRRAVEENAARCLVRIDDRIAAAKGGDRGQG